ncbi:sulfatase-like hydrolase/transferase [Pseudomonas aeruginosa]
MEHPYQGSRAAHQEFLCVHPAVGSHLAARFWRWPRCSWSFPAGRYWLGWSTPFGYLSDLAPGSPLCASHRRPRGSRPGHAAWCLFLIGNAELVGVVGRMPEPSDLKYLLDPQFVSSSTQGGGLARPPLALGLGGATLTACAAWRRRGPRLAALCLRAAGGVPGGACRPAIPASERRRPMAAVQPRRTRCRPARSAVANWRSKTGLADDRPDTPPDVAGLNQLGSFRTPLLAGGGARANVLIVAMEGIPGAYIAANRAAINSSYHERRCPDWSGWAETGDDHPDYVLHSHQTIRGLYAMLCGDYSKLDFGHAEGRRVANNPARARECLPAQLAPARFQHALPGRVPACASWLSDKVMPQMGFDKTLGRDWFRNTSYLEFPWHGRQGLFEGAATYVAQLRQQKKPWM